MFDSHPDSIARQLTRRDDDDAYTDLLHVGVDSYLDRRTAFRFTVSPSGVQTDVLHFNDTNDDQNWDAVWESATTIDSAGWTAELRIPLSQLRFGAAPAGGERRWGLQFAREIARLGEESFWSPTLPTRSGLVSRLAISSASTSCAHRHDWSSCPMCRRRSPGCLTSRSIRWWTPRAPVRAWAPTCGTACRAALPSRQRSIRISGRWKPIRRS
jgi:hypothetical protein